jgi:ubiquinone/menaquinone biosynthesis C-methylase UbiE
MLNVFYSLLNFVYRLIFGRSYMLHAPMFEKGNETLFEAQCAFVDYCLRFLPDIAGKRMMDVGCGNGLQTLHILHAFQPSFISGVDVVNYQIDIARKSILGSQENIEFTVDDAQELASAGDNSFDVVICIESALHYKDKDKFLAAANRVLKPGGYLLIADLLWRADVKTGLLWRMLHLHNWTHDRYLHAFKNHNIQVIADERLNELLIPQLEHADKNIVRELKAKNRWSYFFKSLFIKPALELYKYQLKNTFDYRSFTGRIAHIADTCA